MSNLGITWLHISDWHQGRVGEAVFDRKVVFQELLDDISNREKISHDLAKVDFIVFSGDIAFSGKEEQYKEVKEFFDEVLKAAGLENEKERLFIVPGNHDLEDSRLENIDEGIRKPLNTEPTQLNAWIDKYLVKSGDRDLLLNPFSSFRDFVSNYNRQEQSTYASLKSLDCAAFKVALLGLNSALMARRYKNKQGENSDFSRLIVGEPQVNKGLQYISEYEARIAKKHDVKIAVMHHPFNWLCQDDQDKIKGILTSNFDFVLYGHRHKYQASQVVERIGDCVVIAAGATYESRDHLNSYNFVYFDPKTRRGKVYLRRWDNDVRQWVKAPFLSRGQVVYTGSYEFPPPVIKRRRTLSLIGEQEYSDEKRIDRLNEHYENIAKGIKEGTVVPILGADINSCGRNLLGNPWDWELTGGNPPTNHEIIVHIERQFLEDQEIIATIGCPLCDRDTLRELGDPNFPGGFPPECPLNTRQIARLDLPYLSQYFWSRGWQNNRDRARLRRAIDDIYGQYFDSTHLHEFLRTGLIKYYASEERSGLPSAREYKFPLIVTTCFDRTLERIFEKNEQPYDLVSYSDKAKRFIYRRWDFETDNQGKKQFDMLQEEKIDPVISSEGALSMKNRPVIFRLYGPIDWQKDAGKKGENFAITEDHFLSFLFNVINDEVEFPKKLTAKLETSNLWFLGYNLSYWNQRILLNKIKRDDSYSWWSVQENPTYLERELWAINKVKLFSNLSFSSLEEYIKEIERRLT